MHGLLEDFLTTDQIYYRWSYKTIGGIHV